jgi:hypothetical protein
MMRGKRGRVGGMKAGEWVNEGEGKKRQHRDRF